MALTTFLLDMAAHSYLSHLLCLSFPRWEWRSNLCFLMTQLEGLPSPNFSRCDMSIEGLLSYYMRDRKDVLKCATYLCTHHSDLEFKAQ